jgi:hypothetical protein
LSALLFYFLVNPFLNEIWIKTLHAFPSTQ